MSLTLCGGHLLHHRAYRVTHCSRCHEQLTAQLSGNSCTQENAESDLEFMLWEMILDVRYVMSLDYWTDSQTSHTETNLIQECFNRLLATSSH